MSEIRLSIVVPAFNEEMRIGASLGKIRTYVEAQPFPVEVIVVDDGSSDATAAVVAQFPEVRYIHLEPPNHGKGYAVRHGVLEASSNLVLFTDADLSSPIEEVEKLLAAIEANGAAAAVGSRALRRESILRDYSGRCYNLLVRLFTGLRIHDTQCGFKLFRMDLARHAFELQRVWGFGFDPELLFLVERTGGKIVEVPVRWNHDAATKVRFPWDPIRMFADLISLRVRSIRGDYSH